MAKKHIGYVDLEWTCPACGNRNPGTTKACTSCGAAMPEGAEFELPPAQQVDTSAETRERVAAGPDFLCPYCGARNAGNARRCSQCGGDLSDAARRKAGKTVGALSKETPSGIKCPHCGAVNPPTARKCSQCGGALGARKKPKPRPRGTAKPTKVKRIIPIIFAVFALIVVVLILLNRGGGERLGVISDVTWTYTVQTEKLGSVTHEAWSGELPSGGRVLSCERKVRSTYDNPVVGAVEVCGTPYVVDTGTGKGEVVQDCVYQLKDDWCQYSVMEWQKDEDLRASGHDYEPYWPQVQLGSNRREVGREERYQVRLLGDGRDYTYVAGSLDELRRFEIGSRWMVKPNTFGGVMALRPAD